MSRKRFREREVIETLAWQGIFIPCHRCGKPFFERADGYLGDEPLQIRDGMLAMDHMRLLRKPEREHLHEYNLGGPDAPYNCRYSCSECHAIITNGTKATSAGSSKQRIAKIKRLINPRKSKHPMPKSKRKMPSRPFQKRKPK